jgi:hypothetical protein
MSDGNGGKEAIINRDFPSLPVNCLGIVFLTASSVVIAEAGIPTEIVEIMALAAKPSIY